MDGTLAQGSVVGRYRVDAIVARGGMGIVYRATDVALERPVALKVIAPELARDEEFRARFVRESRLAAALDHPNVIPVYEAGDEDGTLFLAMRFVDGSDLREVIGLDGRLDADRATQIVAQVASALDAAHARGLVHRDVKPANVLLAGSPGAEHAYLTDFGIAKRQETSGLTQTGQTAPTPGGAVPEAQANALTDRYIAAYEGEDLEAMRAILAPDAMLSGPGTFANGREEVLSEFRSTFALIEDPRYELRDRTYNEQPASSTVQGAYEVTDSASSATPTGTLVLTMALVEGQPRITRIVTTG